MEISLKIQTLLISLTVEQYNSSLVRPMKFYFISASWSDNFIGRTNELQDCSPVEIVKKKIFWANEHDISDYNAVGIMSCRTTAHLPPQTLRWYYSAQAHSGHGNLLNFVELSMLTSETCPKNFRLISQRLIILHISL